MNIGVWLFQESKIENEASLFFFFLDGQVFPYFSGSIHSYFYTFWNFFFFFFFIYKKPFSPDETAKLKALQSPPRYLPSIPFFFLDR